MAALRTLTINAADNMGPLEVSLYPPDGDPISFALSSMKSVHKAKVGPGRYAVVARRPNGAQIGQTVEVDTEDRTVNLGIVIDDYAPPFMIRELQRGQIAPQTIVGGANSSNERQYFLAAATTWFLATTGGAVAVSAPAHLARTLKYYDQDDENREAYGFKNVRPPRRTWDIRQWRLNEGRWHSDVNTDGGPLFRAGGFLKLRFGPCRNARAIGLMNEDGCGPIVTLPPFRHGLEVTFVAPPPVPLEKTPDGVTSRTRHPAALVTPSDPAVADFLATLNGSVAPNAIELWDQALKQLAPRANGSEAIKALIVKYDYPAEALLAAHYLLRFIPKRLPYKVTQNLIEAAPHAADGPVIAAWLLTVAPPKDWSADKIDYEFERLIKLALSKPVILFARSRALLFDALSMMRQPPFKSEWVSVMTYRRSAYAAGGLEGIWGAAPDRPGDDATTDDRGALVARVTEGEGGTWNA